MTKNTKNKNIDNGEKNFALPKENYRYIIIGCIAIVIGFVLMLGGGSANPNDFNAAEMFSFRRITLAPIIVIAGFTFVGYAIMRKPKNKKDTK